MNDSIEKVQQDIDAPRMGLYYNRALNRWVTSDRNGQMHLYSRAVMAAHIGRELRVDEHVHHINGNPSDDRISNLALLGAAEHVGLHSVEKWQERKARWRYKWTEKYERCRQCGANDKRHGGHGLCRPCYLLQWKAQRKAAA